MLQWKLNDSYLQPGIKMSLPQAKCPFRGHGGPQSRLLNRSKLEGGKSRYLPYTSFFFLSLGFVSLLLVWQEGNCSRVEGLTGVILPSYTRVCMYSVYMCVCVYGPEAASRQSLSCHFFSIIWMITLLHFSLLSESIFVMILLAELFLCCSCLQVPFL